ncbi:MAG: LicD family protein [Verrucomicrobia bacterium]|nr:LicD family protein [Verrucomicrobiota bacterium]
MLKDFIGRASQELSNSQFAAFDGKIYPRREISSKFHNQLELELNDPEKALCILKSYEKHLAPHLDSQQQEMLQNWLIKNVRFIGSLPFFAHWKGEIEQPIAAILSSHLDQFTAFFEEVKANEKPCVFPVNKDPNQPKNIVIITTTGGGGHKSVADALNQILSKFPEKYKVTIVDFAEIAKPSDPLYRLSGLLTAEEVYDKVFQQHKDPKLATELWQLKPKLNAFVEDTCVRDLKDRIRPLNPDLILSTCHFLDRDLEVCSSLGVPMRFVHCDYELSWALVSLVAKANPQTVKLWLPATDPEILRPTSSKLKSELVQQLVLTHSEDEIDALIAEGTKSVIDYSGFPVRLSFKREEDPEALAKIRQGLNIPEGSQVVVAQMGKQGVGTLFQVIKGLNEDRLTVYDRPVHLAVMCGTNEPMRKELLEYLKSADKHPQIHFEILPMQTQDEVAAYLKIADAELMKPGGAASSEALEMAVKTLIFVDPDHQWEGCNKDQMVRHGIGTVVESMDTIPKQLKEVLGKPKKTDYVPINAEKTVPTLVDEAIVTFEVFRKTMSEKPSSLHVESKEEIHTDAVFKRTPVKDTVKIYKMLDDLHTILTKHGIRYWMDGGTLLGAVRHGGLIPWDDDGDIQIFEEDKEKLLALKEDFAALGYRLVEHELSLKLFPSETDHYPSIDIFTAKKDQESGLYYIGNAKAKGIWPNDYWTEEELSNIVPFKFGPSFLMGCAKPRRYLSTLYGDNHMEVAYQLWNHAENTMHRRLAVQIVDKSPAPWQEVSATTTTTSNSQLVKSSN